MTLAGASVLSIWLGARAWRPGDPFAPLTALGLSLVLLAFAIGGRAAIKPVTNVRGAVIGVADLASATRWSWRRLALLAGAAGEIQKVEAQDWGAGWGQCMALGQAFAEGVAKPAR